MSQENGSGGARKAKIAYKMPQPGVLSKEQQRYRDVAIDSIKSRFKVNDFMDVFPPAIKPTSFGQSALLNLNRIAKKVEDLGQLRALFLAQCKDEGGNYVPAAFGHTAKVLNILLESEKEGATPTSTPALEVKGTPKARNDDKQLQNTKENSAPQKLQSSAPSKICNEKGKEVDIRSNNASSPAIAASSIPTVSSRPATTNRAAVTQSTDTSNSDPPKRKYMLDGYTPIHPVGYCSVGQRPATHGLLQSPRKKQRVDNSQDTKSNNDEEEKSSDLAKLLFPFSSPSSQPAADTTKQVLQAGSNIDNGKEPSLEEPTPNTEVASKESVQSFGKRAVFHETAAPSNALAAAGAPTQLRTQATGQEAIGFAPPIDKRVKANGVNLVDALYGKSATRDGEKKEDHEAAINASVPASTDAGIEDDDPLKTLEKMAAAAASRNAQRLSFPPATNYPHALTTDLPGLLKSGGDRESDSGSAIYVDSPIEVIGAAKRKAQSEPLNTALRKILEKRPCTQSPLVSSIIGPSQNVSPSVHSSQKVPKSASIKHVKRKSESIIQDLDDQLKAECKHLPDMVRQLLQTSNIRSLAVEDQEDIVKSLQAALDTAARHLSADIDHIFKGN
ncbi:hypothetical protein B0J14DRAFT_557269 [Halenospora varia]|nr:hypothetical protein B0J14DRAFT_557269 [Halenospora varia]